MGHSEPVWLDGPSETRPSRTPTQDELRGLGVSEVTAEELRSITNTFRCAGHVTRTRERFDDFGQSYKHKKQPNSLADDVVSWKYTPHYHVFIIRCCYINGGVGSNINMVDLHNT